MKEQRAQIARDKILFEEQQQLQSSAGSALNAKSRKILEEKQKKQEAKPTLPEEVKAEVVPKKAVAPPRTAAMKSQLEQRKSPAAAVTVQQEAFMPQISKKSKQMAE